MVNKYLGSSFAHFFFFSLIVRQYLCANISNSKSKYISSTSSLIHDIAIKYAWQTSHPQGKYTNEQR